MLLETLYGPSFRCVFCDREDRNDSDSTLDCGHQAHSGCFLSKAVDEDYVKCPRCSKIVTSCEDEGTRPGPSQANGNQNKMKGQTDKMNGSTT